MKKRLFNVLSVLTVFTLAAAPAVRGEDIRTTDPGSPGEVESIVSEDAPVHIHLTRDAATGAVKEAARTPLARPANMTYHGGKIMTTAHTFNIFWGPKWANSAFAGDKITGLDSWYVGHSNSNYAVTVDEYTDTVNGGHTVGPLTNHLGHVIDTSTASGGGSTSAILAEACKIAASSGPAPNADGLNYYAVYTDLPRGSAGYCAYHSAGTCGGVPVQFAFFWSLDGDPGCDPQSTVAGESQGLAALANVTAHELSEARSDPASPGAWYDRQGAENGDKCAWTFNVPFVTFPNGTQWKLQGEWSNAAYTAGTGYPNSSGQKGCLDGH